MTEREYRNRSRGLRAPYDAAKGRWAASRSESDREAMEGAFERYNAAQSALFARWCRGGAGATLRSRSAASRSGVRRMKTPFAIFVIAAAVIVAIWFGNLWVLSGQFPEMPVRGQFGDSFGGLNALFSGLAFAALIVTIWTQRQELTLQRDRTPSATR